MTQPHEIQAPIKPIETHCAGHRFRSRLEARWAVLFDYLRIEWLYEPEGFEVGPAGRQRYLPDFYLPEKALWVEVKGHSQAADWGLLVDAAHPDHGLPVGPCRNAEWPLIKMRILTLGQVPDTPLWHQAFVVIDGRTVATQQVTLCCDSGLPGHGHYFINLGHAVPIQGDSFSTMLYTRGYGFPCPDIQGAYTAARSARFEHGESGPPRSQPRWLPRSGREIFR